MSTMVERVRAILAQLPEEFTTADAVAALGVSGVESSAVSGAVSHLCRHGELVDTGRTEMRGKRESVLYHRMNLEAAQSAAERKRLHDEGLGELQGLALAWGAQRARTKDEERAAAD